MPTPASAEPDMHNSSNDAPLVAVVTPVYNGAEFLADAMDSVQAQNYANLIHIVIDNASTDATPGIIERYAQARVPVTVIRNEKTVSIGANWNLAVSQVPRDAKYFRILCADDLMGPDFIRRTVEVAERRPDIVVVGCLLHHRGNVLNEVGWDRDSEVFAGKDAIQRYLRGAGVIIAHQTLIRRSAADLRNPFFEEEMAANDTDACLDMLTRGDWGFVHEVLATTRDHADTYTRSTVQPTRIEKCDTLILLKRYAEFAFGRDAGRKMVRAYCRQYLRQLLVWAARGDGKIFKLHLSMLRRFQVPITLGDWMDAITDWPLTRLRLR